MSARDGYPTARFLVQDEPVPDRRFDVAVHHEINAMFDEIDRLRGLVESFIDDDDCRLDHHGYCQTHGWFDESECVVALARKELSGGHS